MNLSDARLWVRQFARNADDSSMYSNADIDRCIQTVGNRFCRNTKALIAQSTVALSIGDTLAFFQVSDPVSGGIITLMPEQLLDMVFSANGKSAKVISAAERLRMSVRSRAPDDGVYVSFRDTADEATSSGCTVDFWPAATVSQNIIALFWTPFLAWVPGVDDATAQTYTLNLPDSWLTQILPLGPPALLQMHEPQNKAVAQGKWEEYQALEKSFMGAGSLGVRVAHRTMAI